jgi:type VI secretion system secreted protein Hcp
MTFVLKAISGIVIASILILGTLGLSQDAFAAAFVKYDGVDGESADKDHADWIELLSFEFDDLTEISASKDVDKSTPKLMEAVCKGRSIPSSGPFLVCDPSGSTDGNPDRPIGPSFDIVTIDLCRTTHGNERQCYLQLELVNVRVTSFSISGSTDGEQVPTENFSLNFEEIKVTYTEFDQKGKKKGNIEYSWKVEEGEA